jgi:hypothetical protein
VYPTFLVPVTVGTGAVVNGAADAALTAVVISGAAEAGASGVRESIMTTTRNNGIDRDRTRSNSSIKISPKLPRPEQAALEPAEMQTA